MPRAERDSQSSRTKGARHVPTSNTALSTINDPDLKTEDVAGSPVKKFVGIYDLERDRLVHEVGPPEILTAFLTVVLEMRTALKPLRSVGLLMLYEPATTRGRAGGPSFEALQALRCEIVDLINRWSRGEEFPLGGADRFVATVIHHDSASQDIRLWLQRYAQKLHDWGVGARQGKRDLGSIKDRVDSEPTWEDLKLPPVNPKLAAPINQLNKRFESFRETVRAELQAELDAWTDPAKSVSFRDAVEKKLLASKLQRLLNRVGLRVACPKCGEPAIVRGGSFGTMATGGFRFEHRIRGKSRPHLTVPDLPHMKLIPAPDARNRKFF